MPTPAERLTTIRDNLLVLIEQQTTAWIAAGSPQSFSIDGLSVNWSGWLNEKLKAVEDLNRQIQLASGPFVVQSRGRS